MTGKVIFVRYGLELVAYFSLRSYWYDWLWSHFVSTKGPLLTTGPPTAPGSVHLSPYFSTEARCAGTAARYAAMIGKKPRGPSRVTWRVCLSSALSPRSCA